MCPALLCDSLSSRPSIRQPVPPSIHPSQRQVSDWSGQGYFLLLHPSAGKEQGMMTDNTGVKENTHTHKHTHAYSAPTRLLVGFAVGCISILGSRRMHMQMQTMLIVIKGHLPLLSRSLSSLLSSLSLASCQCFAPTASPSHPSPSIPPSLSLSLLSQADKSLITADPPCC